MVRDQFLEHLGGGGEFRRGGLFDLAQIGQHAVGRFMLEIAFIGVDLVLLAFQFDHPVIDHFFLGLGVGHQRRLDLLEQCPAFRGAVAVDQLLQQGLDFVMLLAERVQDVALQRRADGALERLAGLLEGGSEIHGISLLEWPFGNAWIPGPVPA